MKRRRTLQVVADPLSTLPAEVLVKIISDLPPDNVDLLRITSRRIKEVIDSNSAKVYSSRLFYAEARCYDTHTVVRLKRRWWVEVHVKDNKCVHIQEIPFETPEHRIKLETWRSFFLGRPFAYCFRLLSVRSGGVSLDIKHSLTTHNLCNILPILNEARILRLKGRIQVPKEKAHRHLFAPKRRKLFIDMNVVAKRPDLLEDLFWKGTACKNLQIGMTGGPLRMSGPQLMMLADKRELETVQVSMISGPRAGTIRIFVQKLLHSETVVNEIVFASTESLYWVKQDLGSVIGDELIEVKTYPPSDAYSFEVQIWYEIGNRRVRVNVSSPNGEEVSGIFLYAWKPF